LRAPGNQIDINAADYDYLANGHTKWQVEAIQQALQTKQSCSAQLCVARHRRPPLHSPLALCLCTAAPPHCCAAEKQGCAGAEGGAAGKVHRRLRE
jgi:hypothetical protein